MSHALQTTTHTTNVVGWEREQIDLLKETVAKGTSDTEFRLFAEVCKSTGLNPFQRQIYAIMRNEWNPKTRESTPRMTIQWPGKVQR